VQVSDSDIKKSKNGRSGLAGPSRFGYNILANPFQGHRSLKLKSRLAKLLIRLKETEASKSSSFHFFLMQVNRMLSLSEVISGSCLR
jgi:hypothetical protein